MNKKLAILAIFIAISIILGGYNSSVLFGTQYLKSRLGYTYDIGETYDWWDCNWSYSKRIIIHHEYIESTQTNFPVLIYNSSDIDLSTYARSDGDDILFTDEWNSTQLDHEIESFSTESGELVAWVEVPTLSHSQDTILYMYFGNPDCSSQENITGTWNSGYKMVHHLEEAAIGPGTPGTHVDSTINYNNGTVSGSVAQSQNETNLPQMDGMVYLSNGSGYIDFGNDSSLAPSSITLEAWVKDPPLGFIGWDNSGRNFAIIDKKQEHISLIPNKLFDVKRTIVSDNLIDVVFVALYSPGVLIRDMTINNNSVLSGTYQARRPENEQENDIELIRDSLPETVRELGTIAYSHPFQINNQMSVEMQFQTLGWNEVLSNGRISYLVIASDGRLDVECSTHWSSFINIWNPPSSLYDFIRFILGEDKKIQSEFETDSSDIYVSSQVETLMENQGYGRVILRLNDEQAYPYNQEYLLSLGFEETAEIESEGLIAGEIDRVVFESMKKDGMIEAIYYDERFNILLNESLPLIRFNQAIQEFGLTGNGIRICILDTGINTSVINYSYGFDFVNDDNNPHDDNGHGTKVAAVIESIAPDAELIIAKVIDANGVGYESDVLEGLQYCINQNPDIICFSIGSGGSCLGFCDTDFVAKMCNDAVDNGIFIVAASGNDGSQNLTSPACASKVVSVGATDDNDAVASFSNVNPTLDLFAPGVGITTIAGTSSGTSMSAPHVAAAAALILENENLTSMEMKYRLRSTGVPINYIYNDSFQIDICRLGLYNAVMNNKTCEPYNYSWWWQGECESEYEAYITLDAAEPQTYYFNAYDEEGEEWTTNPGNMVDGSYKTYAQTTSGGDVELCTSNTCDGTNLGTIYKVEIRAYGYKDGGGIGDYIILRPVFSDGDGDNHLFANPTGSGSADWSSWFDITEDTNAPSPWTWGDVEGLDCDVVAVIADEVNHFCSEVEIRVTVNNTPLLFSETPSNNSINIDWDIPSINVTIEDPEGDTIAWSIETSPDIGDSSGTSTNGSRSCSVSGLKPATTYTWYVNATDVGGSGNWTNETYYFTTKQIRLLNCSTWSNKTIYGADHSVVFSAWVDACNGTKVSLLIANSTGNLYDSNYTDRSNSIANSSNITITTRPQKINASMTASESATWYAKICDNESRYRYMRENTSAWNKSYDGPQEVDVAYSVAADTNNNLYVVGYGTKLNGTTGADWWIMRFNATTGVRDWNKTYDGKGSTDVVYSVAVDNTNDVYVVGSGFNLNGSSGADIWIMKFNGSTGSRTWNKTFDSEPSADTAYSVALDSNNMVYVVGYGTDLNGTSTDEDWWIMRFNGSSGAQDWNKTYHGGTAQDFAYSVATSNDKVYVVGYGEDLNGTLGYDWWIMRFNTTTGNREWNKTFSSAGDENDVAYSVACSNDDIYVVGQGEDLNGSTGDDWWLLKFNSSGSILWNKTFDGEGGTDVARSVAVDLDENIYVTGYGTNLINASSSSDFWIKKFNATTGADDTIEWNKKFGFTGTSAADVPYSVTTDSDRNVYVVGSSYDRNGTGSADWWIKKFEYITGELTVDTTPPTVEYMDPTPDNNTHRNETWFNVNLSSSDTSQHYAFLDFNRSLLLWMVMDETENPGPIDLSSYENDGLNTGAVKTEMGRFGYGWYFDGVGDWINVPALDNGGYGYENGAFTISLWIKTTLADKPIITDWWTNSGGFPTYYYGWRLTTGSIASSGALRYEIGNGDSTTVIDGDTSITNNGWTHVVVVDNGDTGDTSKNTQIFINGNLDKDAARGTKSTHDTREFNIARDYLTGLGTPAYISGTIDDVLLFNRSLNITEIRALYNASTYQYGGNFTSMGDGWYTYTGYDPDEGGNRNETEERNVTIDTVEPSVEFVPPTPSNGSQTENYIHVNISSSDLNQHYAFTDFNSDLILWMRMDDYDSGIETGVYDKSSYGNDGAKQGNADQTDNGYYGKAFTFDGDGDYIDLGSTNLITQYDNFTISTWAKLNATTGSYSIYGECDSSSNSGFYFYAVADTGWIWATGLGAGGVGLSGDADMNDGKWHHITFVKNNNDFKLYNNGNIIDSDTDTYGTPSIDNVRIGDYYMSGAHKHFKGEIDEVLAFKRGLDQSEIRSLYNASAYQYEHNFTGLTTGNYTFIGYDPDRAGNWNQTESIWRNISVITVLTNESTGTEETSITLWGYLQDDGGENCTVRFEYGTTPSYGTNSSNQTKAASQEFNTVVTTLNSGTLYYYRAYANNTKTSDTGSHWANLTKPLPSSGLSTSTPNQTAITLAWAPGSGANNTYIVRNNKTFPSGRTDGTIIYNGSGTAYQDTGLDQKTRYYYGVWSYTTWDWAEGDGTPHTEHQWSDSWANVTAATTTLRLINCSTDKSVYGDGDPVTFTAWVDADIGSSVILLIANSTSNLDDCDYTNQDSCIPGLTTSTATITSQPQAIAASMNAESNTTWYAKVCDSENRCSYTKENKTAWDKTYHMDADHAESVANDSNDNVYIVGNGKNLNGTSSWDWWIMKFNSTGDREWNKTYDDGGGVASKETANSVAVDSNDNVYVVGCGYKLNGTKTDHDWWIMRFNATTGNQDWNKTYHSGGDDSNDIAQEVAVDTVDNVYVVGHGTNLNDTTNNDWWIMRFNATTGNRDWNKTYSSGGNNQDVAYSVTTDSNDDVYVVGYGTNLNDTTNNDWWIMKFNSSTGNRDWNKTYDDGSNGIDMAQSVAVDSSDNVYVVGHGEDLNGSTDYDWWIMRFNATTGNRDWNKTYDSGGPDAAYSVAVDSSDNVYVVGYGDDLNGSTDYDWWIKRFNSTGSQDVWNWNLTYDGNGGQDYPRSVAVDSNDSVYVVGTGTDLNGSTGDDWWIKKFEYFTGNFTVLHQNKEIIKMSQSTYSLEMSSNGTELYGYVGANLLNAPIDTSWHYVALVYDDSIANVYLYKDAALVDSVADIAEWEYPSSLPNVTSGKYLTGHLDELRISSTARSSAWINTSYQNMNAPTSFATFEDPEGVLKTWTYRKKITINGSLVTGSDGTHSDFPVLIYNSSDENLSDYALATGNDIIFLNTSFDWTTSTWRDKLDHEIEKYENGELVAWVRIPQINVGIDTEIYMYYGNTLCTTNRENITGVWNSNYVMVQHLNESSGTLYDSTSYGNNGTNTDNNATHNSSSKIDGGCDFDGENDTIEISDDGTSLDFDDQAAYTWSMWVKLDEINRDHWLIKKEHIAAINGLVGHGYFILVEDSNNVSIAKPFDGGAQGDLTDNQVSTSFTLQSGLFYHIAVTYSTDQIFKIYINGTENVSGSGAFCDDTTSDVKIGDNSNDDDGNRSLNGTLDEVRISNVERTQGWLNTSYNNVNDTANFLTFGTPEERNIAPIQTNPSPADDATGQSLCPPLSIEVSDINADCLDIYWKTNSSGSWTQFGNISSSATNRFGYDAQGSDYADLNHTIRGSNFTCPANGTAYQIIAYVAITGDMVSKTKHKAAIYYASNNTILAETQELETGISIGNKWETYTFSSPPSVTAGWEYYLVLWANCSAHEDNYAQILFNGLNTSRGFYDSQTYNGYPNPWNPTEENRTYSIYMTYNTTCLSNGTYYMDNVDFSSLNRTYYWNVGVYDGGLWNNKTYSFTTKNNVIYYFNEYDVVGEVWATNPSYMVDGNVNNYASTTAHGDVELCTGNSCPGIGLGTIAAVELRAMAYNFNAGSIILRPVIPGIGDGSNHEITLTSSPKWSNWIDITLDFEIGWQWSNIVNLDCDVEAKLLAEGTVYCSKVEVRVSV